MTFSDPILALERRRVRLQMADGQILKGLLVSFRNDFLCLDLGGRWGRVLLNKFEVKSIAEDSREKRKVYQKC